MQAFCDGSSLGLDAPTFAISTHTKLTIFTHRREHWLVEVPFFLLFLPFNFLLLHVGAYGDMYLTDYSDAIDSLRYDYLPGKSAVSQGGSNSRSVYSARSVQGVIISCSGDIKVLGADKFIPVAVWIFDPVFVADKSTSSEMLGVPVRVRKLPPQPAWKDSGVMNIYGNQEATRLFRDMDPEHEDFGLISRYWDLGVGSVSGCSR